MTGRETGSDALERAKTTAGCHLAACRSERYRLQWLRPVVGRIAIIPVTIMVLLLRTSSPEKRENAHPCLRKNRGRLLWCPCDRTERLPHLCRYIQIYRTIGAIETMRRSGHFCQQTTNQTRLRCMLVSLL